MHEYCKVSYHESIRACDQVLAENPVAERNSQHNDKQMLLFSCIKMLGKLCSVRCLYSI